MRTIPGQYLLRALSRKMAQRVQSTVPELYKHRAPWKTAYRCMCIVRCVIHRVRISQLIFIYHASHSFLELEVAGRRRVVFERQTMPAGLPTLFFALTGGRQWVGTRAAIVFATLPAILPTRGRPADVTAGCHLLLSFGLFPYNFGSSRR